MQQKPKQKPKQKIKPVYFTSQEANLLAYAEDIPNFSRWVKNKIANEIEIKKSGIDPELIEIVDRLLETKLAGRALASLTGQADEGDNMAADLEGFF